MKETTLTGESKDILNENIETLKELFPEIVSEDKIDFDKFKTIFGGEIDDSNERYSFTWPGKIQAIKEAQKQSTGTLRPCKEESKNWDTTKNLYIEGDNLEVLKLLQKSYYNKVKCIYIDPPYNTGKDFIYKDNYQDNLENYLELSGQISRLKGEGEKRERESNGIKLSTNVETAGRYHSNWLNMMYPRLKLARNLLTDDGVIFISIDENEFSNLKRLCDEIFGEDNSIGEIIRKTKTMTGDSGFGFNLQHEYLLIYGKNINLIKLHGEEKEFKNYSNDDNDPKGDWCLADPSAKSGGDSTYFPIENPFTHKIDYPPNGRYWAFSEATLKRYIKEGKVKFKKEHKDNERGFIFKRYKCDVQDIFNPVNSLFIDNDYLNEKGTSNLKEVFNNTFFDYPKPVKFIKNLIKYSTGDNDIILDFFSGSATSAHAVLELNSDLNSNKKFFMVQLPEETDEKSEAYKAGYKNICEIGKERISRVGEKIIEELDYDLDIGFKVFKLDSSNLEKWDPDYDDLEQTLLVSQDNIKEGRTQEDLIYEIMLNYGIDLTLPIEKYESENTIYSIGFGALLVCLDNKITKDITDSIIELASEDVSRVVFKDNGFASDADKTNIKETLRTHNIDEFITI